MLSGKKLKTTKSKEKVAVAKTVVAKTAKMKNLKAKAKEVKAKEVKAKVVKAKAAKPTKVAKVTKPKAKAVKPAVAKPVKTKVAKKVIGRLSEERQAFEKSINKGEFSILKTKQRDKKNRTYLNALAKSLEETVKLYNRTKNAMPELPTLKLSYNGVKLEIK